MNFDLNNAIIILKRTPAVLSAYLKDMPEAWSHMNEGPNTWSAFDVVGHLIHGEKTDWITRTRIILESETNDFEPFDMVAHYENSKGKSLNTLLEEFEAQRTKNLKILESFHLSDEQLKQKGNHPEFGKATLREMLATWVVHDMNHIAQISRVMSKQYEDQVGPWKAYIGILNK